VRKISIPPLETCSNKTEKVDMCGSVLFIGWYDTRVR